MKTFCRKTLDSNKWAIFILKRLSEHATGSKKKKNESSSCSSVRMFSGFNSISQDYGAKLVYLEKEKNENANVISHLLIEETLFKEFVKKLFNIEWHNQWVGVMITIYNGLVWVPMEKWLHIIEWHPLIHMHLSCKLLWSSHHDDFITDWTCVPIFPQHNYFCDLTLEVEYSPSMHCEHGDKQWTKIWNEKVKLLHTRRKFYTTFLGSFTVSEYSGRNHVNNLFFLITSSN